MPKADPQQVKWLDITDFSPGCYSNGGTVVGNSTDRMLPAPPGAADAEETYACYAIPSGGLAAWMGQTQTYSWPANFNASGSSYIVGCLIHDELSSGHTEAVLICEYDDGTTHSYQAISYIIETATANQIVLDTTTHTPGIFGAPYPQFTRMAPDYAITGVTATGTSTTITVTAPLIAVNNILYFTVLPGGITGLALATGYVVTANTGTSITISTAGGTGGSYTGSPAGAVSQPTQVGGTPVVVFPAGSFVAGITHLYVYPDPSRATAASFAPHDLIYGTSGHQNSTSGQVLVHQSRVVVLVATNYAWPTNSGTDLFFTNENINFTDPPNSLAYGDQLEVLAAEEPYGYGCGGSISAGELFIVKHRMGGIIVTGDIFSPNVTILPGVTPTGNIYGSGASTSIGFVYCSYQKGAWSWNGSNTSQKISQHLDDNFFVPPEFSTMQSNNYLFFVSQVGDKVLFNNNWMYDTRNQSWWTYYPRKGQASNGADLYYTQNDNLGYVYACQLSFTNSSLTFLRKFDPSVPSQVYQWQSLPLKLDTEDRVADVREIVIKASCSAANGIITVTLLDQNSIVWGPTAMPADVTTGPQLIRFNTAGIGVQSPAIRINVANSSTGDMPIIHSIGIKFVDHAHIAVQD